LTGSGSRSGPWLTRLGALALVLLAAAALFWPRQSAVRGDGSLLVLLPEADARRHDALAALAAHLGASGRLDLHVQTVPDRAGLDAALGDALVIVCPDGAALSLPSAAWQPLAVGRRRVPWNLRPTSVLVSRLPDLAGAAPWRTDPRRTVLGDSLSLVCLAPLCPDGEAGPLPAGVGWGRDPYDHRGVLEAARHGAYDHAVVRQWDADLAFAAGRLDPAVWQVRRLSEPMPDVVVLVSRRLAQGVRLDLQEALSVLGRRREEGSATERRLETQLGLIGLEGFNLLLGPDFDRIRQRYGRCWPRTGD
jgi:hypothetical protein